MSGLTRRAGIQVPALLAGTIALLLMMALPGALAWAQTKPAAQTLNTFAAGSLRGPITAAASAFEAAHPGVHGAAAGHGAALKGR